ncbi:MAG: hypothetical protein H0U82_10610 [Actinobacteria bacterium]|nr:hypothetical protein [Actinomycetota bacterium]
MKWNRKIMVVAATGAALAVAGGGAAFAAADVLSPEDESAAVIDDAANQLGVEPGALSDALRQALKNRIDEAVEAGRLTEKRAETLKERLDAEGAPLFFGGFGHGPDHGHLGHVATLETAAWYLELTEAELRSQLAGGKSLAEIAEAEGKSVDGLVRTLVDSARTKLDQAVEDGRLTKAQADEIKGILEERITELVNRDPGSRRGFMEPRFRHGFGAFHAGHGLPEPRA